MKQQENIVGVLLVALLIVALIFAVVRCRLSCGTSSEKYMSHRLPSPAVLLGDAYSKTQLPDYTLKHGWPYDLEGKNKDWREQYTDIYDCNKQCEDVAGATPQAQCIQDCMVQGMLGASSMNQMDVRCQSDGDCFGEDSVCVSPSYYGGGKHGYCMYTNNPGIPRHTLPSLRREYENIRSSREGMSHKEHMHHEGFTLPKTCPPEQFFNEAAGRCEPRFQGVSSARAVHMAKPGPPPDVSLSGSTFPGYGIGLRDPVDIPLQVNGHGPVKLLTDM